MQLKRRAASLAALVLLTAPTLQAQVAATVVRDAAKQSLIQELLNVTHAVDLAVASMEAAVPAQKAASPRVPPVFWERFLVQARLRRTDLATLIAAAYDRHLSAEELRQIVAFYHTPVGQKLIAELPGITQESMQAGQAWGAQIGRSVAEQLANEGIRMPPPA